jgi:tetratricopeptide (TPR) repeat protein
VEQNVSLNSANDAPDASRLSRLINYLATDPSNIRLRRDVLREACRLNAWDVLRRVVDEGLAGTPSEASLLAWQGFSNLQLKQYGQAETALTQALAQGLEPAEIRYNLALAQFLQKNYVAALSHLSAPLLPFELPSALLLRARCQHALANPKEAIDSIQAYLKSEPEDAEANGLLALLLYESNLHHQATIKMHIALKADPTQREALVMQATMQLDAQDFETAKKTFAEVVRLHPDCGRGWLGLALVDMVNMDLPAAASHVQMASRHMPEHIGTWHVRAWIHLLLGDVDTAERAFHAALAIDRTFAESHGGVAVIEAIRGQADQARMSIKRALRLDPHCLAARYAEHLLLKRDGRDQDADTVIGDVLARNVPFSDLRYRDLVAAHAHYLKKAIPVEKSGQHE